MTEPIVKQILAVSSYRDPQTREEGLLYSPYPLYDAPPPPEPRPVDNWDALDHQILQVRLRVQHLIDCVVLGTHCTGDALDVEAGRLALMLLPRQGLTGLMGPGVHPQFSISDDFAARVPWEALIECCLRCPKCGHSGELRATPDFPVRHCPDDGERMEPTVSRLAVTRHLTHVVHRGNQPPAEGKGFLFIEDPTGDLCSPINDPDGVCACHLRELRRTMTERGFEITLYSGPNATYENVRLALQTPGLMGIYYFGHGFFSQEKQQGFLRLADLPLQASEIAAIAPAARFAFINACFGADDGGKWGLDRKCHGVADAFAKGGGKVVIAPICPVVNVQAAAAALEFFRQAVKEPVVLGEALMRVRETSLKAYEEGHRPDISWLAYRYFGDPNRTLPVPTEAAAIVTGDEVSIPCRVFDGKDRLDTEVFAFAIDDVLLRAAKRRNFQERTLVNTTDLAAGLVRKGELTRFLLHQDQIDPDDLYETFGRVIDPRVIDPEHGTSASTPAEAPDEEDDGSEKTPEEREEERLRRELARWIVHDRDQFTGEVIETLTRADQLAQRRPADVKDRRVSEQNVLESLLTGGKWPAALIDGLPTVERMQTLLEACRRADEVDENGTISLEGLDKDASEVIRTIHALAQQRGVCPITHRLVLAGFLAESEGVAARACRDAGAKPEMLFVLMIALSAVDAKPEEDLSHAFGLSYEACSRIVLPMLHKARENVGGGHPVTERDLFKAFCEVADPAFKEMLNTPPEAVNLDGLRLDGPPPQPPGPKSPPPPAGTDPPAGDSQRGAQDDKPPGKDGPPPNVIRQSDFDEGTWRMLMNAAETARLQGWPVVRTPHLFAAMIGDGNTYTGTFLRHNDLSPEDVKRGILSTVPPQSLPADAPATPELSRNVHTVLMRAVASASSRGRTRATEQDLFDAFFAEGGSIVGELLRQVGVVIPSSVASSRPGPGASKSPSILSSLGVSLTDRAREGKLPTIVGRDREIETAMQTLLLTENANPLLVGEAGVGKTAIVEAIAQRIVDGNCPRRLRDMEIIELSAGNLVANTRLRGEFEQRIQEVLAEARGNVILFIDEIHTIVGAGLGEGGGPDAGNMLKAALARGETRMIGATTFTEYKRSIERDKALSRRFQVQMIGPPSREDTLRILSARQDRLEEHHAVRILEEAKEAAIDLSGRYIMDQQWPAKARDVLERACVAAASAATEEETAVAVNAEHVARVVANRTGIPLEKISAGQQASLETLEERLNARIIGQQLAVRTVGEAIRKGRKGLAGGNRPWGVFLFVGPPGVGKTELAKVIAEEVYDGPEGLIRFDMGDFTEPHAKAKLIGAPPGYIGYDQGAALVERLRRHPYSLLLFDEIEHAHEDVLAVLLRLLSEGTIEAADGAVADARNAIVIMTSNALGASWDGTRLGFARTTPNGRAHPTQAELRSQVERILPVKLIDRLDAIVPFDSLTAQDLEQIARIHAGEVLRRVESAYGVTVEVAPDVWPWLAARSLSESPGARAVQRTVDAHIAGPLGEFVGTPDTGQTHEKLRITLVNDQTQVQAAPEGP